MSILRLATITILAVILVLTTTSPLINSIRYSKAVDAGRNIYLVSPSPRENLVFGQKLLFKIIVFREDVETITVYVCGKPYKATMINNKYPYIYIARIPVYKTDQYSWRIVIMYKNGETETTCIGVVDVTIHEKILVYQKIMGIHIQSI